MSKKRKLTESVELELEEVKPKVSKKKTKKARKSSIKTKLVKDLRLKRKEYHSKLCQINRDLTSLGAKHKKQKCK